MSDFPVHYIWWSVAFILAAAEVLTPGFFLLWIGIAAALMGGVLLLFPGLGALPQALLFITLAFLSCMIYWRFVLPRLRDSDDPEAELLNHRADRLLGKRLVLVSPIRNGRGKVAVGDGQWLAEGPDLPLGSEVEVVAVEGGLLRVRAITAESPADPDSSAQRTDEE